MNKYLSSFEKVFRKTLSLYLTDFLGRIVLPHPSIQEPGRRRRVKVLTSLLLSIVVLGVATVIWKQFAYGPNVNIAVSSIAIIICAAAYGFSRSKYYQLAYILIIIVVWGSSISGAIIDRNPQTLYFMIFSALIGGLFLTPRETILVSICSAGLILLLPAMNPIFYFSNIINPAFMVILSGVLSTVAASVQLQDFRHIEQQTSELSDNLIELMQSKEALQQSEARLQLQIARMPIACIVWDTQFKVTSWNPAAEIIFGFSEREAIGRHSYDLIIAENAREHVDEIWARLLSGDTTAHSANENLTKNGQPILCDWSNTPLKDPDGKIIGVLSMVQDVTERKRAELRVQNLIRLYATLSQVNQTIVRIKERGELFETICKVAVDYGKFGMVWIGLLDQETGQVTPVAVYGKAQDQLPFETINVRQAPFKDGVMGNAVRSGRIFYSTDIQTDPTMQHWYEAVITSDYHSVAAVPFQVNGEIVGLLNLYANDADFFADKEQCILLEEMSLDISMALETMEIETQRKQAEVALQQSEERFASAFRSSPTAITIARLQDGKIIDINDAWGQLFGCTREEAMGRTFYELGIADVETRKKIVDALKAKEPIRNIEVSICTCAGQQRDILFSMEMIDINDESCALATMIDITEQKRAEHALRQSEERYRNTLDNMLEGCQIIGFDWRYLYVNDAVARHGHKSKEMLLGSTMMEIYPGIENTDMFAALRRCMTERTPNYMENEFTYPDGTTGWFDLAIQPVPEGVFVLSVDITERKRMEKVQAAIYRISQAAAFTENIDELYRSVHHILGELIEVQNFYIALYEPANDLLSFPYFVDQFDPSPPPGKAGHGLTEYVLRSGKPLLASPQVFNQLRQQGEVEVVGTDSIDWMGVPLKTEERVIGVMVAQSYTEGIRYSQEDVDLLEFISTQVALAIARKQTDEQLKQNAIRAEALAEISQSLVEVGLDYQAILDSVTRRVATLVGDACGIILLSDDGKQNQLVSLYHPQPEMVDVFRQLINSTNQYIGEGMIGGVLQTGQPIIMDAIPLAQIDVNLQPDSWSRLERHGVQSFIIVPMRAQGRVIGALGVTRSQPGRSYQSDDQVFLQEIADRTALAIMNAQLYSKVQNSLSKMQALRQIDIAITGSVDLRISLGAILEQVISQMGVDAANVLVLNSQTLTLDYIAGRGFHTDALQHTHLRIGEGYAGRAARERQIIKVEDLPSHQTDFLRSLFFVEEGFVSYYAIPLIAKGLVKGVLEIFHRSPLDNGVEWLDFLEALAGQAAIAIDNASLFDDLQHSNLELVLAYDATIEGWSHALDLRDNETEGHTQRVTELTLLLAREMGISGIELVHMRRGALLHDIGKMGIPDKILLKPGPLSDEEWVVMRKHPEYAYEMLAPIAYLRPALDIPFCHHEKWDGTGYPRGLKGKEIPIAARIFAVVDVWDALRSDRPYRRAWEEADALDYIRTQAGRHFDQEVVQMFLEVRPWKNKP
jgi:PAS domain S-box-containing protein